MNIRRRLFDLLFILAALIWAPLFWLSEHVVWRSSRQNPGGGNDEKRKGDKTVLVDDRSFSAELPLDIGSQGFACNP